MTFEPRPLPYSWADVKVRLQDRLPPLLDALGLRHDGRASDPRVFPLNPVRDDRRPGSFVVWTTGTAAGAWKDYALGEDAKGDVFDLIAYCLRLQEKIDAYWWALEFLGLERGRVRTKAQDIQDRERRAADAAAEAARDEAAGKAKQAALFKLWLSLPPIAGTPAERYLREARRIPLERLAHQPGALRWAERVEWIDPETGEVFEWRHCMVAAGTRGTRVTGLHRTWLKPDGSGKAGREKDKTMIGSWRGAAIRLSPGPSGLSPTKAEQKGVTGPLAVGEGIETCLPVAVARADYRVWAAGSLGLMGLLDWPACASAVVLLRDNDWSKPEAMAAFARVEAHWRGQARGRPVVVAAPPAEHDDFNSWAQRGAA